MDMADPDILVAFCHVIYFAMWLWARHQLACDTFQRKAPQNGLCCPEGIGMWLVLKNMESLMGFPLVVFWFVGPPGPIEWVWAVPGQVVGMLGGSGVGWKRVWVSPVGDIAGGSWRQVFIAVPTLSVGLPFKRGVREEGCASSSQLKLVKA